MNKKKKPCSVCGKLFPEHDLEPIFTGRRRFLCQKCLEKGERENNHRSRIGYERFIARINGGSK